MIIIFVPILVCLLGLVIFYNTTNAKTSEVAKIMFWVGLFVSLIASRGMVEILSKGN